MDAVSPSQTVASDDLLSSQLDPSSPIISWLLSSEAQISEGPEKGGVLGWADIESQPQFIYSEITGYYLTFLSYLAKCGRARNSILPRVNSAAFWIERNWKLGHRPTTRTYLGGRKEKDWRNNFHFSFDLAMMLRGIVSAAEFLHPTIYRTIRNSLSLRLDQFVDDAGLLNACSAIHPSQAPATWSARTGPYQLKMAVPILELHECVSHSLRSAAHNVVGLWEDYIPKTVVRDNFHPLLYFIEGLVLLGFHQDDRKHFRHAESVYCELFATYEDREFLLTASSVRSDVVAQVLRLGSILRLLGYLRSPEWMMFLNRMAKRLLSYCGPNGAVYFQRKSTGQLVHANTWSSMFAVQALQCYQTMRAYAPFNPMLIRLLV